MTEKTFELEPVEIYEWSLVDKPAIEWEFLIIKKEDMMEILKIKSKIEAALKPLREALEEVKEDSKEGRRLKLIIANLEGMLKVSKSESEDEVQKAEAEADELEKQLQTEAEETEVQEEEDVEKAGRKLSKATKDKILQAVKQLKEVASALESLANESQGYGYPKYGYPEYGSPKTKKQESGIDLSKMAYQIIQAHKEGLLTEEEIARFASLLESEE